MPWFSSCRGASESPADHDIRYKRPSLRPTLALASTRSEAQNRTCVYLLSQLLQIGLPCRIWVIPLRPSTSLLVRRRLGDGHGAETVTKAAPRRVVVLPVDRHWIPSTAASSDSVTMEEQGCDGPLLLVRGDKIMMMRAAPAATVTVGGRVWKRRWENAGLTEQRGLMLRYRRSCGNGMSRGQPKPEQMRAKGLLRHILHPFTKLTWGSIWEHISRRLIFPFHWFFLYLIPWVKQNLSRSF